MYLTGILEVPCLQIGLHNDDNEVVWCANKRIRPLGHHVFSYLYISEDYTVVKNTKPRFPGIFMKPTAFVQQPQAHSQGKHRNNGIGLYTLASITPTRINFILAFAVQIDLVKQRAKVKTKCIESCCFSNILIQQQYHKLQYVCGSLQNQRGTNSNEILIEVHIFLFR